MRGLNYISWADNTGYAVAAKSYLRALRKTGIDLTWTPILRGTGGYVVERSGNPAIPEFADLWHRPVDYDTVLIHTVPDFFPKFVAEERAPGRRIFGYTVWELEKLPAQWPGYINQLDGVLVPCEWNAVVFRNSGVTVPIYVVPHLSQFEDVPAPTEADRNALASKIGKLAAGPRGEQRYIFYTIGTWTDRKAPYLVLEAYWRAFSARDPVLMVVKTSGLDITRWVRSWRYPFPLQRSSTVNTAKQMARKHWRPAPWVIIPDEDLSDGEIQALHDTGNCFVSLARTEGWGLGAFEAARFGKPVVMTGYGGQLDFLDPELAWLVDYKMVPEFEHWWKYYKLNQEWADPSVDQAAAHMKAIYTGQADANMRAQRLAANIAERFSVSSIIQKMLAALRS